MINKIKNYTYSTLRWSEQYTQTDMVYLAKGGFWLTLGQAVSSLSIFLLSVAMANLLPKETYGSYKYIVSAASLLGIFSLSGMNSAVVQAVAKGFEGDFKKSFKVQLKWGLLMFSISLLISLYYFINTNSLLGFSFLAVGLFSPIANSANTYAAFLGGKKNFRTLTFYGILATIISSIAIFTTILISQKPLPLIFVYFIAGAGINLFLYIKTISTFKPNTDTEPGTINFGKHLSLSNVILTIANYIDGPLIFHFLGPVNLAIYSFATGPAEQIKAVFKNISSLAIPKFSNKSPEEIKKTLVRKVLLMALAISVVVIFYILFAPLIYKIFFPKYLDSIPYSQVYAISIIAIASLLPYSALQAQAAKKELYIFNAGSSILQIILLVTFIYFWGIWGAIISRLIARSLNLGLALWLTKKI